MNRFLPGTTLSVDVIEHNTSYILFSGLFAGGGIALSQVSSMTGLEPYMIQNWVRRRFVSPPKNRRYSQNQFARIVIINMLKESLTLDEITGLLVYINGVPDDESDDIISDSELYHRFVHMLTLSGADLSEPEMINNAAEVASKDYDEPIEGAKKRLKTVLEIMAYARLSSEAKKRAEWLLKNTK